MDEKKGPLSWTEKKALKRKRLDAKKEKSSEKKPKEDKNGVDTEEESARLLDKEQQISSVKTDKGRHYTVSMALPGSILENAQSRELRSYLAGQIARAAVVFNIDEIVIFDESGAGLSLDDLENNSGNNRNKKGYGNIQLARILQFLECPQYLRKHFFPMHEDLKFAGLLNPLDSPHHMRISDKVEYREGVVLEKKLKSQSCVNAGLYQKDVLVDKDLEAGLRVTVELDVNSYDKKVVNGKVVSPSTPRIKNGLYWGYNLRLANNLSSVLTQCPYKGGYDVTIGTSERGDSIDDFVLPQFRHAIIVFGGVQGLETSLAADKTLSVEDPSLLFHHYLNTCPNQGSRTIRTEEAVLITLSSLRNQLVTNGIKYSL
ncbi:hypothetical protein LOTGIDRAFT_204586 [Lottia gigantea]|uniref:Uncharacterized protein n=1 Tax=Lottia gigantea TaxID=225164 RepID=V3ZNP3_LOTGI|nr:hypothetical protein LOTGIDRAFT_204586 [Lottia gigantea]ESO85927.1 hypothetical protein LOTGIDRAFT_204586 [Lottia gigantea]